MKMALETLFDFDVEYIPKQKFRDLSKIPIFSGSKVNNEQHKIKIKGVLTQTHQDILEAIAVIGKKGIHKDRIRFYYIFDTHELLSFLGYKKPINWLIGKLSEIRQIELEIETDKVNITGRILDYCTTYKKEENKNELFAVVFSEMFSKIFFHDFINYVEPEVVKAIVDIKHDFIKLVARYCLSQEKTNISFKDLLQHLEIQDSGGEATYKYTRLLEEYQSYLQKHFEIIVTKEKNEIYIQYEKEPEIVFLDLSPKN